MGQTDLDRLVGNEAEDIARKSQTGTPRDRADEMPMEDKIPVKAMPMKATPTPFKLTGGGNGGG